MSSSLLWSQVIPPGVTSGIADDLDVGVGSFTQSENKDRVIIKSLYVKNKDGDHVLVGQVKVTKSDDGRTFNLTSLEAGHSGNQVLSIAQLNTSSGNAEISEIYVRGRNGGFASLGQGTFVSDNANGDRVLRLESVEVRSGDAKALNINDGTISVTQSENDVRVTATELELSKDTARAQAQSASLDVDTTGGSISAGASGISIQDGTRDIGINHVSTNSRGDLSLSGTATDPKAFGGKTLSTQVEATRLDQVQYSSGEHSAAISITAKDDGGIEKLGVKLGDDISFVATDGNGNARELKAAYYFNEQEGRFYFRTTLVEGDKVSVNVKPFTFDSEKVGEDARLALEMRLNKQNVEAYLDTVTGLLDFHEVNKFLAFNDGAMRVRLGDKSGMEFFMQVPPKYGSVTEPDLLTKERKFALGTGFFFKGPNAEHSAGVLISADSSFEYKLDSGHAYFNGKELPDQATIPTTIGAYYRYDNGDTAVLTTLGAPLAEFEDGTVSAGVAYEKSVTRPGENTKTWSLGAAANTNGDVSAQALYTISLDRKTRVRDTERFTGEQKDERRRSIIDFANSRAKPPLEATGQ
jgi:hypothetical protein